MFSDCESYKGDIEYICNKIDSSEKYHKCAMKEKKCTSVPIEITSCGIYIAIVGSDKVTKEGCESVKNALEYEKCVYDAESKSCQTSTDYKGKDPTICRKYGASDDHECGIVDEKCVEIKKYAYKDCFYYKGKNKEVCESIQPNYDFRLKCFIEDGYCNNKYKECSDAKSEVECVDIRPSNNNKMCIFNGNSCVEQYKSCEEYKKDGGSITKEACESIILPDNDDKDYFKKKCQFNENDKSCKTINKKCSDFKVDSIANLCYKIPITNDAQRCSYSNSACTLIDRPTCYELSESKNVTEEFCSKATTTNENKVCGLKSDSLGYRRGCQEYSNPSASQAADNQSSYKIGAKYLDIFAIALLCLWI